VYTKTDRNGFKWIYHTTFSDYMLPEVVKFFENKGIKFDFSSSRLYLDDKSLDPKIRGERKREFIKWYYDTSKKIIKKHGQKIIDAVKKTTASSVDSHFNNDEIVFSQYKVKGVYVIVDIRKKDFENYQKELDYLKDFGLDLFLETECNNLKKTGYDKLFKGLLDKQDVPGIDKDKGRTPDKFAFGTKEQIKEIQEWQKS
jgi:hypothetical protein